MKSNLLILALLFPGLLIGCSSSQKSSSSITNSIDTPTIKSSNKNQPVNTDVYKTKEFGDWQVTLLPLVKENDFEFYKVDFKFQGTLPATNVKIKLGNGVMSSKEIAKDQGGIAGSTFPSGVKQIEISITWTVRDQSFNQSLTLNTGQ